MPLVDGDGVRTRCCWRSKHGYRKRDRKSIFRGYRSTRWPYAGETTATTAAVC